MADSTIEWTDATSNPVAGYTVLSPGYTNCYAMRMAARLAAMGQQKYRGLTHPSGGRQVWTGGIHCWCRRCRGGRRYRVLGATRVRTPQGNDLLPSAGSASGLSVTPAPTRPWKRCYGSVCAVFSRVSFSVLTKGSLSVA